MEIKKYDYFEARFSISVQGNPFDLELKAKVICPDKTVKTVNGFYDGGDAYAFRFMPECEGEYHYEISIPNSELNDKTGSFICTQNENLNHGKVKVKDRFWFEYEDGTPYFEAGTTCYAWIHQSEELQEQTLQTLANGYFNKLRMCVFPKWYEYNHRQPQNYPFTGDVEDGFDYDRPNVGFFRHLENCINKLARLGVEADIILFHPYDSEDWRFNAMTPEQDERYLRYAIARLSAFHNVWWSLANEYDLLQTGYKRKKSAWKKLIHFVHEHDPYGHLTSIHQLSKMYDHRDPYLTHCSIQRTEMFLTAEYTDSWREKYNKPVVIDECCYEGNLNTWWGGITAEELVRRFWEATARGGYMGHSETYDSQDGNIWWSHGGVLRGKSAERIKFLREIMADCPDICFTSESTTNNTARAIAQTNAQIVYFGNYQPCRYTLNLLGGGSFRIKIIDTWNMTITELPESMSGKVTVALPTKPYIAILCLAECPGEPKAFTRDSVFEEMKFTPGGQKMLKLLKKLYAPFYSGMLHMTINQCSAQAGGILDGRAGDGIVRIVNKNEFWRGLWQLLTGAVFRSRKEEKS